MVNPFYILQASLTAAFGKAYASSRPAGGQFSSFMPRVRPRAASTSLISLSDLRPRLGVFSKLVLGALDQVADVVDILGLGGNWPNAPSVRDRPPDGQDQVHLGGLEASMVGAVPSRSANTESCSISTRAA